MIVLNGHNLSIAEVWQAAALQSPCQLADDARPLIRRSRKLVESLAARTARDLRHQHRLRPVERLSRRARRTSRNISSICCII